MVRGWLSLLRSGTCTQKGKWCRVLGESSSERGPVIGLRREPDRGGEDQKPNGAGTPRTRPDETKDRQARQQAKGGREARRRDERTSTRAGRQARTQAGTHTHAHKTEKTPHANNTEETKPNGTLHTSSLMEGSQVCLGLLPATTRIPHTNRNNRAYRHKPTETQHHHTHKEAPPHTHAKERT